MTTFQVPISVRYFDDSGLFGIASVNVVSQELVRTSVSDVFATRIDDENDQFAVLNAAIGYRLPRRVGIASVEISNILDRNFNYLDDNYRTSGLGGPGIVRSPRLVPERTVMGRVTLTF